MLSIFEINSYDKDDIIFVREETGAPNNGIFPNASEVSEMCHSVLGKPV